MAESTSGQDEANPVLWLATQGGRLEFPILVPEEKVLFMTI